VDKPKSKRKAGTLEVAATVTGPDGVTYTVTGCSVEEVRAALAEVTPADRPAGISTAPAPEVQS
jgi:hypothetical protein